MKKGKALFTVIVIVAVVVIAVVLIFTLKPKKEIPLGSEENPIIWSFVPSGEMERVASGAQSVADLLYEETGLYIETNVATEYAGVIEALASDPPEAHMASLATFAYVLAADRGIAEAALVSVLWDHWRFHGAEPELNDKMHEIWRSHCPHQMLPMELPRKLIAAGFSGVAQKPIAFINGTMHENAFALWATKLVAAFAIRKGVRDEDAVDWLDQLEKADAEGRFGFVSVPVLTTATAASS